MTATPDVVEGWQGSLIRPNPPLGPGDFMAQKKPNKAKLSIKAPSQPALSTAAAKEDEQWKIRDDADKIKRYAELTRDQGRHKAAIDHINSEHQAIRELAGSYDADEGAGPVQPRALARAGRKKSTRVPRKGSRR